MKLHTQLLRLVSISSWLGASVLANTEKTIFLGPQTINIPSTHPNLEDLRVDTLKPEISALRIYLEAQFPSNSSKHGKATWLVLDELTPGQRYEVRVCWAATQPTEFRLTTYELPYVFETPELMSELSEYSWSRQTDDSAGESENPGAREKSSSELPQEREAAVLFLQILAAADYYTTNKTLMSEVPPVYVDVILDPYVLNVLPRSLLPTVGYIIVVAFLSYFLAQRVSTWIQYIAMEPDHSKKQQ